MEMTKICLFSVLALVILCAGPPRTAAASAANIDSAALKDFVERTDPKTFLAQRRVNVAFGIGDIEFDRFVAASVFIAAQPSPDQAVFIYYDIATSCALHLILNIHDNSLTDARLGETPHVNRNIQALNVSLNSFANYLKLSTSPTRVKDNSHSCAVKIDRTYGSQFDQAYREFSILRRHTRNYLVGGNFNSNLDIESKDEELSKKRLRVARNLFFKPKFLTYFTTPRTVIVVFGDPISTVKWLSEYAVTKRGTWRFLRGIDAGMLVDLNGRGGEK